MAYLSPQILFNYLLDQNKPLSLDDISDRFDSVRLDDILSAANSLEMQDLVDEVEVHVWAVSDKARQMLKAQEEKDKLEAEKSSKEFEKLHLEIDDLVNRLSDYDTVKNQARIAIICAVVSAIAALIALLK